MLWLMKKNLPMNRIIEPTPPPLTPALSPLRGEGERRLRFTGAKLKLVRGSLSLLAICCFVAMSAQANPPAAEMAEAANKFLASLDAGQKAKASFDFKGDERENWHFIPKTRNGLTLKEMTPEQRKLAQALFASGFSQQGYSKATNIMSLEPVLFDLEGAARKFPRDPELYHVSVFGKPGPKETWGWRLEGHHVSANFTIVKGEFTAVTPSFFGTNPAEVKQGPRAGLRILAGEEDLGRQVVKSLSDDQKKMAIIETTAPKEIITEAKRKIQPLETAGIPGSKLNKKQSDLLLKLIHEYVFRVRPDLASDDLKKIEKAGVEKIYFAWAGGLEHGEGHYYRVQGPTFLLEYDNTQNNNNHIHAVWRDFDGDFGEDLLLKHYQEVAHP